jgi:hypothetical protein
MLRAEPRRVSENGDFQVLSECTGDFSLYTWRLEIRPNLVQIAAVSNRFHGENAQGSWIFGIEAR